jgi:hypothetical protein
VTRRNSRTYTVELSTKVPFGVIAEAESDLRIVGCPADEHSSTSTRPLGQEVNKSGAVSTVGTRLMT